MYPPKTKVWDNNNESLQIISSFFRAAQRINHSLSLKHLITFQNSLINLKNRFPYFPLGNEFLLTCPIRLTSLIICKFWMASLFWMWLQSQSCNLKEIGLLFKRRAGIKCQWRLNFLCLVWRKKKKKRIRNQAIINQWLRRLQEKEINRKQKLFCMRKTNKNFKSTIAEYLERAMAGSTKH